MKPDDLSPIYYRVSPAIWRQRWSEQARYLALYLLTCNHRSAEGLFVLPKGYILGDLKWSAESLAQSLGELLDDGFIQYDEEAEVCFIVKALDYQPPRNPNMVTAAVRRIKCVPKSSLDKPFMEAAERYAQSLAQSLGQSLPERFGKPQLCSTQLNSALPRACASGTQQPHARGPNPEIAEIKSMASDVIKHLSEVAQ